MISRPSPSRRLLRSSSGSGKRLIRPWATATEGHYRIRWCEPCCRHRRTGQSEQDFLFCQSLDQQASRSGQMGRIDADTKNAGNGPKVERTKPKDLDRTVNRSRLTAPRLMRHSPLDIKDQTKPLPKHPHQQALCTSLSTRLSTPCIQSRITDKQLQ